MTSRNTMTEGEKIYINLILRNVAIEWAVRNEEGQLQLKKIRLSEWSSRPRRVAVVYAIANNLASGSTYTRTYIAKSLQDRFTLNGHPVSKSATSGAYIEFMAEEELLEKVCDDPVKYRINPHLRILNPVLGEI